MMRSPPPPQSQNNSNYGSPYAGQTGGGTFAPGFGGFMNDPTAQMGYQLGKTALNTGQEYMEQNVYKPFLSKFSPHSSFPAYIIVPNSHKEKKTNANTHRNGNR